MGFGCSAGVDACSGSEDGMESLKERRGKLKVGMCVGRSMTEFTLEPGSSESKGEEPRFGSRELGLLRSL